MQHRNIIITGAGRGIGRELAQLLSKRGWGVVLVSRTKDEIAKVAAACESALPVVADIADAKSWPKIVARAMKWHGRIDGLVNNAGYAPVLSVEQTTPAEFRRAVDVNLSAAFGLGRECWPHFVEQKSGVIVNVSSMAAKDPLEGFHAYGASKAGLNLLTLSMAREGAKHNIRVHGVAPGAVETGMFRRIVDEKTWPKSKTLPPGEVAALIADILDGGNLKYTSGETIYLRRSPM